MNILPSKQTLFYEYVCEYNRKRKQIPKCPKHFNEYVNCFISRSKVQQSGFFSKFALG